MIGFGCITICLEVGILALLLMEIVMDPAVVIFCYQHLEELTKLTTFMIKSLLYFFWNADC